MIFNDQNLQNSVCLATIRSDAVTQLFPLTDGHLSSQVLHMVLEIDTTRNAFEAVLSADAVNDFQIDSNNASQFDGRLNATGIGAGTTLIGGPFSGVILMSVMFDQTGSGTAEVFLNGQSRGTMSYTAPIDAAVTLLLMTNRAKNARVDGAVAEIAVTGALQNRQLYHDYLAEKWGVT